MSIVSRSRHLIVNPKPFCLSVCLSLYLNGQVLDHMQMMSESGRCLMCAICLPACECAQVCQARICFMDSLASSFCCENDQSVCEGRPADRHTKGVQK